MSQEDGNTGRFDDGSDALIAAFIEVHTSLGPGLLESAYGACLGRELELRGLRYDRQRPIRISYKGFDVECGYRLDLVVENRFLVEIKAVERLLPIHEAQVLTYLKLTSIPVGFLVNFNARLLRDGLRRLVVRTPSNFPSCPLPVKNSPE